MSQIYTYSPEEIELSICGYVLKDIEDIKVKRNEPKFSVIRGIRGYNSRRMSLDTSCEIDISLLHTSVENDLLSQLIESDGNIAEGQLFLANLSVVLQDNEGTTKIVCNNDAFIKQHTEADYTGDTLSSRKWIICCLNTSEFYIGGNYKPTKPKDVLSNLSNT
jgi:hypothetical protein